MMNDKPIYRNRPEYRGSCEFGNVVAPWDYVLKQIDKRIDVERVNRDDHNYLALLFEWRDEIKERLRKAA